MRSLAPQVQRRDEGAFGENERPGSSPRGRFRLRVSVEPVSYPGFTMLNGLIRCRIVSTIMLRSHFVRDSNGCYRSPNTVW